MWFRVFQSQAMMHKCSELLLFPGDVAPVYQRDVLAAEDEKDLIEGGMHCQRRLSRLLWAWTDMDVDLQHFFYASPKPIRLASQKCGTPLF